VTNPDYGLDDVALEQRIAELDDDAFDRLVQRTRLPKSTHPATPANSA
jgi:hypothetical protein